jgi:hypothetical protein
MTPSYLDPETRLGPEARAVIGHGESEQEKEEEDARKNDDLRHLLAGTFHVHEKQDNKNSFQRGYRQCNNRIPGMKIHERCTDSNAGQYQERDENKNVKPD